MTRSTFARAVAVFIGCVPLAACATSKPQLAARLSSADDIVVFDQPIRLHLRNGDIVSFSPGVSVQLDSIYGDGVRSDPTLTAEEQVTAVARAEVELVQSFHGVAGRKRPVVVGVGAAGGLFAALLILIAANGGVWGGG